MAFQRALEGFRRPFTRSSHLAERLLRIPLNGLGDSPHILTLRPSCPLRPVPLARVHVQYDLGAGNLEDVFSPAAFRADEGVSEHSVVDVFNSTGPRCR